VAGTTSHVNRQQFGGRAARRAWTALWGGALRVEASVLGLHTLGPGETCLDGPGMPMVPGGTDLVPDMGPTGVANATYSACIGSRGGVASAAQRQQGHNIHHACMQQGPRPAGMHECMKDGGWRHGTMHACMAQAMCVTLSALACCLYAHATYLWLIACFHCRNQIKSMLHPPRKDGLGQAPFSRLDKAHRRRSTSMGQKAKNARPHACACLLYRLQLQARSRVRRPHGVDGNHGGWQVRWMMRPTGS
jgi:hypothetical protein